MKESVLDVLMYLFETYFDAELETDPEPDRDSSRKSSARRFHDREIEPSARMARRLERIRSGPDADRRALASIASSSARAGAARQRVPRLYSVPRAHRHPAARAAGTRHRPAAGARPRGDRRRADEMGRDDGAVQSAGPEKAYARMEDSSSRPLRPGCTEAHARIATPARDCYRDATAGTATAVFVFYGAEEPRHRRIACEGADHREVSR